MLYLNQTLVIQSILSTFSPIYLFADRMNIVQILPYSLFTNIVLLSIFITLIIIIVFQSNTIHKLTNRSKKIEQQLLLSQMNPHFVFNSLTAIQSYIFRNDPHQAGKYLSSFAKLVRLILENSRLDKISIEQELKTLRLYFDLQLLRFEGKFDYTLDVDENLDIDSTTIPPMLAQPFIENAIEHGIIHLSEKGLIIVRFIQEGDSIVLEVEDNGIGIEKSRLIQMSSGKDYTSRATEITNMRLRNIKRTSKTNITLKITDLSKFDIDKQGTLVRFNIPLK